jgi:hypothetical protein
MRKYYSRRSSVVVTVLDLFRELVEKVESVNDILSALDPGESGNWFQKAITRLWCEKCAEDFFRENYSIDDVLVIYEDNTGIPEFLVNKEMLKQIYAPIEEVS